jgi:hypothetical protein
LRNLNGALLRPQRHIELGGQGCDTRPTPIEQRGRATSPPRTRSC